MRFLLEADNQGLLGIKKNLEQSTEKPYKSMNDSERTEFIGKVISKASNATTLKPVIVSVAEAIKDSNWDKNIIKFLDKINLPNGLRLTDGEIRLITELLADNKISPNASWLYNRSLYDRDVSDTIYTIKALTLASNEALQTQTNETGITTNKYFKNDKPLKVSQLTNKNGTIKQASEIEDIINKKTDITKQANQDIAKDSQARNNLKNGAKVDPKNLVREYLKQIDQYKDGAEEIINKTYNPNISFDDNLVNIFKELGMELELKG